MSRKKIRIHQPAAVRKHAAMNAGLRRVEGPATINPLPKGCFLATEDEPQFRILLSEYIATYCPQHRDEYDLLTEAVYAKWRQQRFWLAESAQIEIAIAKNETTLQKELPRADAAAHLANGIAHSEAMLRLYARYHLQLHRQYLRCLQELRDLQSSRHSPNEPNPSPPSPNVPSAPPPAGSSDTVNEINRLAQKEEVAQRKPVPISNTPETPSQP
jgi:hypothetical protein